MWAASGLGPGVDREDVRPRMSTSIRGYIFFFTLGTM